MNHGEKDTRPYPSRRNPSGRLPAAPWSHRQPARTRTRRTGYPRARHRPRETRHLGRYRNSAVPLLRDHTTVLDEPSNHLDMKTKDIIKDALRDFDGTLILVSHDRDFLDGLATKVFEFGNKRVKEHFEDIAGFLAHKKMENLSEIEK